jgi:hypothetical protein
MEWVEPNFNFVDIVEYEMCLEQRRSREDFVLKFFKDWEAKNDSNLMVEICQDLRMDNTLHLITDDLFNYVTIDNFATTFRSMCLELFKNEIKNEYIASILTFCTVLDEVMKSHLWYSSSLMLKSLTNALEESSFCVKRFNWNRNLQDSMKTNKSQFIIEPPLLFFYFACKGYIKL